MRGPERWTPAGVQDWINSFGWLGQTIGCAGVFVGVWVFIGGTVLLWKHTEFGFVPIAWLIAHSFIGTYRWGVRDGYERGRENEQKDRPWRKLR